MDLDRSSAASARWSPSLTFVGIVDLGVRASAAQRVRGGRERAVRAARRKRRHAASRGAERHERFHVRFLEPLRDRADGRVARRLRVAADRDVARARGTARRPGKGTTGTRPATYGTATSPSTTTRCRNGGSTCSGSRSSSPSSISCFSRDSAAFPACSAGRRRGAYAIERTGVDATVEPLFAKYRDDGHQGRSRPIPKRARWASACSSTTARSATARRRSAARLPEPHRQRLALRRRAGDTSRRRSPTDASA